MSTRAQSHASTCLGESKGLKGFQSSPWCQLGNGKYWLSDIMQPIERTLLLLLLFLYTIPYSSLHCMLAFRSLSTLLREGAFVISHARTFRRVMRLQYFGLKFLMFGALFCPTRTFYAQIHESPYTRGMH